MVIDFRFRSAQRAAPEGLVLFNGSNTDERSRQIYAAWLEQHQKVRISVGDGALDIDLSALHAVVYVTGLITMLCRLDLLLHVVHHRHGANEHDGGNDLVRVKTGMEETPGDAYGSEGLHHLEVACR